MTQEPKITIYFRLTAGIYFADRLYKNTLKVIKYPDSHDLTSEDFSSFSLYAQAVFAVESNLTKHTEAIGRLADFIHESIPVFENMTQVKQHTKKLKRVLPIIRKVFLKHLLEELKKTNKSAEELYEQMDDLLQITRSIHFPIRDTYKQVISKVF